MSLHAHPLDPIPELTSRIAHASFPKGTLAMHLRDALGPIYEDADFADLFPKRGRAAEAPWRLALVTVLQAQENLSDLCWLLRTSVLNKQWCDAFKSTYVGGLHPFLHEAPEGLLPCS